MIHILIKLVQVYQVILSPVLNPSCRYHPTCSQYVIEAIEKKGVFVGIFKGLWRIIRCHPFGGSGYDPVK